MSIEEAIETADSFIRGLEVVITPCLVAFLDYTEYHDRRK